MPQDLAAAAVKDAHEDLAVALTLSEDGPGQWSEGLGGKVTPLFCLVGQLLFVCLFVFFGWLVGWSVGWLVGWLLWLLLFFQGVTVNIFEGRGEKQLDGVRTPGKSRDKVADYSVSYNGLTMLGCVQFWQ